MRLKKTSFLWGILIFAVTIAVMVFAAAPIQRALGMWGVAITELLLLAIAVGAALLLRFDFRAVFRFRLPKLRQIVGVVLMTGSGMLIVTTTTLIIFYFFPQGMRVATGMSSLFSSMPLFVSWLIIAVMPAICEEMLHRGVILHTFSAWKSKWAVVFAMGFIFGLFHLDPIRFLATAILGGILTYIALESDNLVLPMLYHLLNNSMSVLSSQFVSTDALGQMAAIALTDEMTLLSIGLYLIMSAFAVPVLRLGCLLVKPKPALDESDEERTKRKKSLFRSRMIAAVLMVVMLVSGVVLFGGNMMAAVQGML